MTDAPRRRLRLPLPHPAQAPCLPTRPLTIEDAPELAALMFAAYAGTPDEADAGQNVADARAEIAAVFAGEHGAPIPAACLATPAEGPLTAAALVTRYQDEPLLAYIFTHPAHTGRALASGLIAAITTTLTAAGAPALNLAVTPANTRAAALYHHLGFRPYP